MSKFALYELDLGPYMKPPKLFNWKKSPKHQMSFSRCIACDTWKWRTNIFRHEGRHWILCAADFEDYWENTDVLQPDYVGYET